MWSEWKCVSSTPPTFDIGMPHSIRFSTDSGPESTTQNLPPANTTTLAFARERLGSGADEPAIATRSASSASGTTFVRPLNRAAAWSNTACSTAGVMSAAPETSASTPRLASAILSGLCDSVASAACGVPPRAFARRMRPSSAPSSIASSRTPISAPPATTKPTVRPTTTAASTTLAAIRPARRFVQAPAPHSSASPMNRPPRSARTFTRPWPRMASRPNCCAACSGTIQNSSPAARNASAASETNNRPIVFMMFMSFRFGRVCVVDVVRGDQRVAIATRGVLPAARLDDFSSTRCIISRATIGPAFWFWPVTRSPSTTTWLAKKSRTG